MTVSPVIMTRMVVCDLVQIGLGLTFAITNIDCGSGRIGTAFVRMRGAGRQPADLLLPLPIGRTLFSKGGSAFDAVLAFEDLIEVVLLLESPELFFGSALHLTHDDL